MLKIEPAHGPANGISTCIKGKFAWGISTRDDRLMKPLLREGDTFVEITWDDALDVICERFKAIRKEHGPDALAFIASSKCTNEESFLMQKLSRAVIGTNNVDNCAATARTPATRGFSARWAMAADSGSIADIEKAGAGA